MAIGTATPGGAPPLTTTPVTPVTVVTPGGVGTVLANCSLTSLISQRVVEPPAGYRSWRIQPGVHWFP